ncbi:hypothetical protein NPIL_531411 [Nephila pilipes]|uniref:Uncharacterized protein n=1 Tax=Nephila pilipes TaxID=299642 RepID=A0A8X6US51_NEPPI|nr:hypothetical protein NPIL_531411 [Nephila pilipes]
MMELSSEEEIEPEEKLTSREISDILGKWQEVSDFVEKRHPEKLSTARASVSLFDDRCLTFSRNILKRRQKQTSLDRYLVKAVKVRKKYCPKTSGASKTVVDIAVEEATVLYNDSISDRLNIMKCLGCKFGHFPATYAFQADSARMKGAEVKSKFSTLHARRARRMGKKKSYALIPVKGNLGDCLGTPQVSHQWPLWLVVEVRLRHFFDC